MSICHRIWSVPSLTPLNKVASVKPYTAMLSWFRPFEAVQGVVELSDRKVNLITSLSEGRRIEWSQYYPLESPYIILLSHHSTCRSLHPTPPSYVLLASFKRGYHVMEAIKGVVRGPIRPWHNLKVGSPFGDGSSRCRAPHIACALGCLHIAIELPGDIYLFRLFRKIREMRRPLQNIEKAGVNWNIFLPTKSALWVYFNRLLGPVFGPTI